jgi:transposase InsO family protein
MSRKGNCWDNACAESFFKTLKAELETLDLPRASGFFRHSAAEIHTMLPPSYASRNLTTDRTDNTDFLSEFFLVRNGLESSLERAFTARAREIVDGALNTFNEMLI